MEEEEKTYVTSYSYEYKEIFQRGESTNTC